MHVARTDTPTLRFEDTYTGTFPGVRTWDIGASSTELFVKDVTNSSSVPFRILPGAPTDSLRVSSTGQVGIGTASPSYKLHVSGSSGSTQGLIEETNGTTATRTMLELRNNGSFRLNYVDTSTGTTWGANVISGNYNVLKAGSGVVASSLQGNGNLTIAGTLTQGSDRDSKRDIAAIQPKEILAKVANLPITSWNRKTDPPAVRHLGPMAQDFAAAFGLGEDDRHIAVLDIAGVSLASIQALIRRSRKRRRRSTNSGARRTTSPRGSRLSRPWC